MGGVLSNFQSTCPGSGSEDFIDGVTGHNNVDSSVDCLLQKFVLAEESRGRMQKGASID